MTSKPEDIIGHVILVAHLTAAPGKGEEAAAVIRKIMDSANSDAEPGTLVYRVSRFNEEFVHFEEYESAAALQKHQEQEAFLNLVEAQKAKVFTKVEWAHYKEM